MTGPHSCPRCAAPLTRTLGGYVCASKQGCGWGGEAEPPVAVTWPSAGSIEFEGLMEAGLGAPGQPAWDVRITHHASTESVRVFARTYDGAVLLCQEARLNAVSINPKEAV